MQMEISGYRNWEGEGGIPCINSSHPARSIIFRMRTIEVQKGAVSL